MSNLNRAMRKNPFWPHIERVLLDAGYNWFWPEHGGHSQHKVKIRTVTLEGREAVQSYAFSRVAHRPYRPRSRPQNRP